MHYAAYLNIEANALYKAAINNDVTLHYYGHQNKIGCRPHSPIKRQKIKNNNKKNDINYIILYYTLYLLVFRQRQLKARA